VVYTDDGHKQLTYIMRRASPWRKWLLHMTHMSQIWHPLLCSALLTIMSLKMKKTLKNLTSQQMQMMASILGITIDTKAGLDAIPAFLLIPQCLVCCSVTTTSIASWWGVCISTWKQKQKFQWMFAVDCHISIGSLALLPQPPTNSTVLDYCLFLPRHFGIDQEGLSPYREYAVITKSWKELKKDFTFRYSMEMCEVDLLNSIQN